MFILIVIGCCVNGLVNVGSGRCEAIVVFSIAIPSS